MSIMDEETLRAIVREETYGALMRFYHRTDKHNEQDILRIIVSEEVVKFHTDERAMLHDLHVEHEVLSRDKARLLELAHELDALLVHSLNDVHFDAVDTDTARKALLTKLEEYEVKTGYA